MLILNLQSRIPIYEQICDKIKESIAIGELQKGQKLPAVRALAKELGINHNTIQKAFSHLERENIVMTISGKGTFVSEQIDLKVIFRKQAIQAVSDCIEKNLIYGISRQDVLNAADRVFAQYQNKEAGGHD